jgi:hypothetical protein
MSSVETTIIANIYWTPTLCQVLLPRGLHVFAHLFLLVMPDIGFIVTLF